MAYHSTPLVPNDSIMNSSLNISNPGSLRRGRKSFGPPINDDWKSVDENERNERRRSAALRQSRITAQDDSSTNLRLYSENDINSQLNICAKLYAENVNPALQKRCYFVERIQDVLQLTYEAKINIKNAWTLKIIDVLQQLVTKNNPDILKIAGGSLAIAGKVYGLRVDDLHSASLKLAMDLTRTFSAQSAVNEENEENVNPEDNRNDKNKRTHKKKRPFISSGTKHTVNHDPKAWKGTLQTLESAAFSIKTNNTISTIGNLYTNTVRMDPSGFKFMRFSKEKAWCWQSNQDLSVKSENIPIKLKIPETFKICALFEGFQVNEWDPDKEDTELLRQCHASQHLDQVVYDKDGIPIPELDGSIHDFFEENGHNEMNDNGMEIDMPEHSTFHINEHRLDFRPNNSLSIQSVQKSHYSYNTVLSTAKGEIEQIWAGPSHWKFKYIKAIRPVFTGADGEISEVKAKKKKMQKKNEDNGIDFDHLKPPLKDLEPYIRRRQINPVSDSKISLNPFREESKNIIDNIDYLISMPSIKVRNKKQCPIEDEPPLNYEYDNPNDSNYCPNRSDDNIIDQQEYEEHIQAAPFVGENLTDAPETVTPFYLNYAIKAKRMDMKKLKVATWELITQTDTYNERAKVIPMTFADMLKNLPSKLSEKMREELSCPLAFMALLHLCNEHNLCLKSRDQSNFDIIGANDISL